MAELNYNNPFAVLSGMNKPDYTPSGFIGGTQWSNLNDIFKDQMTRSNRNDDLSYEQAQAKFGEWRDFAGERKAESEAKRIEAELKAQNAPEKAGFEMDDARFKDFQRKSAEQAMKLEMGMQDLDAVPPAGKLAAAQQWAKENGLSPNHPVAQRLFQSIQADPANGARKYLQSLQSGLVNTPEHLKKMQELNFNRETELAKEGMGNASRERVGASNNATQIRVAQIQDESRRAVAEMRKTQQGQATKLEADLTIANRKAAALIQKGEPVPVELQTEIKMYLDQMGWLKQQGASVSPVATELSIQILNEAFRKQNKPTLDPNPPRPRTPPPIPGAGPAPTKEPPKPLSAY